MGNSKYLLNSKAHSYDLAIPLLDIDPKDIFIYTPKDELRLPIAILIVIEKAWEQPTCPEWIN